ncbi:MAG: phytoene desaturase family protein [Candidatus Helarchaeota archaeon]
MKKRNAYIVGSGIGGMALSVLLASKGFATTVLEKNHLLGGRCTSYEKIHDGEKFIVDMWTHTFPTAERAFNKVFKLINSDFEIKFYHFTEENPPQIWQHGRDPTNIPTSLDIFYKELEKMQQARSKKTTSKKPNPLSKSNIPKIISDIFSLSKKKLKELDEITFEQWLQGLTDNKLIINWLGIVCAFMFVTMAYDTNDRRGSAAGETIRSLRNWFQRITSGYPYGGSVGIVNGYKHALESMDGTVEINTKVDKILVDDGKVVGIEVDGNTHDTNLVISNAGVKETVLDLVGEKYFPKSYVKQIKQLEVSEGAHTWAFYSMKFGLDKKLIKPPIIFPMRRMDDSNNIRSMRELIEEYMVKDRIPPSSGMYVTIPSNMDPSLAPPGKQLVNIGCIGPVESKDYQKWYDFYIGILETWVPDFRKHVLFMDVHRTGKPLQQWTGRFQGDAVGISQSVGQVRDKRPLPNTPIKGLYLVGADVGIQGIGTELSALSALHSFKVIQKDITL